MPENMIGKLTGRLHMGKRDKIYSIPDDQARTVRDYLDGHNIDVAYIPNEGNTAWVDDTTIEILKELKIKPIILKEEYILPVFHLSEDTAKMSDLYDMDLTPRALCADPNAAAVVYIGDSRLYFFSPKMDDARSKWEKYFITFPLMTFFWLVLLPPGSGEADDMARWVYQDLHKWNEDLRAFLVDLGFNLE